VATGAGLDVAASFIEHETVLTVAIPVGIFLGLIYALYYYLVRRFDPFHMRLLTATGTVVALALAAAVWGVDMAVCLVILMCAPVVTVVGYEIHGYQHQADSLVRDR
jgi:ABC-type proline/glycine betaine transport system permease subunit